MTFSSFIDFMVNLYGHPYSHIGILVGVYNLKPMARLIDYYFDQLKYSTLKYERENYEPPSTAAYLGSAFWSFILIPLWPLTLFIHLYNRKK